MTEAAQSSLAMTVEEFLNFDDGSDTRYELLDGVVTAMAPPSARHSVIGGNIAGRLYTELKLPCRIANELGIALEGRNYFQADLAVICEEVGADNIPDPIVIIEIVSPTSYGHDAGRKVNRYREIETCQTILLVETERPRATLWQRHPDGWLVQDHIGLGSSFDLPPVGARIALSEVYAGIVFE